MKPLPVKNTLDPKVVDLIRHKVCRIVGLSHHDREDLAQDAALHLIQQLPKHDASRASLVTFADRVVGNKIMSILRGQQAQKRDRRRERSLMAAADVPAGAVTPDKIHLALDVKHAISGASPQHLAVAWGFMDGDGVADVMRLTGLTRQRVRTIAQKLAKDLQDLRPEKIPPAQPTDTGPAYVSPRGPTIAGPTNRRSPGDSPGAKRRASRASGPPLGASR